VPEIVGQSAVNVGQREAVEAFGDLFGLHAHVPVVQQDVQRDARLPDTDGASVVPAASMRSGTGSACKVMAGGMKVARRL
jgi:hypothetical protein